MFRFRSYLIATGFFLLAGQAHTEDLRLGVEALVSSPSADLKKVTNKEGLGVAFTLDWHLSGSHVLRPRLEFLFYPQQTVASTYGLPSIPEAPVYYSSVSKRSMDQAGIGIDYLYYLSGRPVGWHLHAGAVLLRYTAKVQITETITGGGGNPGGTPHTETLSADQNRTRGAFTLGLGYDFDRSWRTSLRFTSAAIEDRRFNAYTLGIGYRF
jgi:hypothetical protein